MKQIEYITASEIGDYVYCKRAWWLRWSGLAETTPEMEAGTIRHTNLHFFLTIMKKLITIVIVIMILALISLFVSFFLSR